MPDAESGLTAGVRPRARSDSRGLKAATAPASGRMTPKHSEVDGREMLSAIARLRLIAVARYALAQRRTDTRSARFADGSSRSATTRARLARQ